MVPTLDTGDPLDRETVPFPVVDGEDTAYAQPFLGGYVVPRSQFVDIDGDADSGLFLHERTGELMFFENTARAWHRVSCWPPPTR